MSSQEKKRRVLAAAKVLRGSDVFKTGRSEVATSRQKATVQRSARNPYAPTQTHKRSRSRTNAHAQTSTRWRAHTHRRGSPPPGDPGLPRLASRPCRLGGDTALPGPTRPRRAAVPSRGPPAASARPTPSGRRASGAVAASLRDAATAAGPPGRWRGCLMRAPAQRSRPCRRGRRG